jgi:biotin transport system permease protein
MRSLYSERITWLHRVPAGWKLLCLAGAGTALCAIQHVAVLGAAAVACAVLWLSLGAAAAAGRKLLVGVWVVGALVAAFHAYTGQLWLGVASALRLFCTVLLGTLLSLTTRQSDLLQVFEQVLAPLARWGVRVDLLALQLALMLRFVEHFFLLWRRLDEAHRLRTGRSGGVRILPPLIVQTLISARRVADTLQVRIGQ